MELVLSVRLHPSTLLPTVAGVIFARTSRIWKTKYCLLQIPKVRRKSALSFRAWLADEVAEIELELA